MMFHPGIMALLLGSALILIMLCYSSYEGVRILRYWDMSSGSEYQLELERRTYLISTFMSYAMGFQLLSLFLFIYTADTLSPLFIGAMCAAGSLKVNGFGYPALMLKIVSCLLAGLWLIINSTDNKAYDYPLIRIKYWILICISPFIIGEAIIQGLYLVSLEPNVITSCCAMLFSMDSDTVMSDLLSLPLRLAQIVFFVSAPITIALGLYVYFKEKGAGLFAISSLSHFIISIVALISFISIYIYELPTHHCPFCILHQEYSYVGYFLYLAILVGGISGIGAGAIYPFRNIASLETVIPSSQKRLALISLIATSIYVLIAAYSMMSSNLSMAAY
jgi:hypothetical protein